MKKTNANVMPKYSSAFDKMTAFPLSQLGYCHRSELHSCLLAVYSCVYWSWYSCMLYKICICLLVSWFLLNSIHSLQELYWERLTTIIKTVALYIFL